MNSNKIRRIILEQSKRANVGHIGSCLSVTDIISALYGTILNITDPDNPNRDRFVLSKGHAALALYAALSLKGWITAEQLNTFHGDGSLLGVHPEHQLHGIDFTTGSLGQGISFGVGAALAAKMQQSERRIFVLMSDAELNEGSTWEAVMFAGQHQLDNLYIIIDMNGQQALGYTKDILDLHSIADKWGMFGWHVEEVNGHDQQAIIAAVDKGVTVDRKPHVILAETVFGKGVSYMEHQIKWHYWPMSDDDYSIALQEINED